MVISGAKEDNGADLKRLVNVDDVWTFRLRKPPPGYCILGRFLEPGVFAALKIEDRNDLGADKYTTAGNNAIGVWGAILGNQQPFRHANIEEYPKGVIRNVDRKEE